MCFRLIVLLTYIHTRDMDHDYWDPEDVLAEVQRVPCTFNMDLPGLGFLEGTGEQDVRRC